MKVFVICTVRIATPEYRIKLEEYVRNLEEQGHIVHLPHRDTNQEASGLSICLQNYCAILSADEVHIFFNPESTGTHFDLGVAFALNKRIKVIENVPYGEGKSFPRMLDEWEESQRS
jgi:nucleoside 2-deoxyribosyltransferase